MQGTVWRGRKPGPCSCCWVLGLFLMRFDFELQICIFGSPKMEASAFAVRTCNVSDREINIHIDLRIRWPQVVRFGPNIRRLGSSDFSNRKMSWSLNTRCCQRHQVAAERSMSWMVTQLYSDAASRPTSGRLAAPPGPDCSRVARARP